MNCRLRAAAWLHGISSGGPRKGHTLTGTASTSGSQCADKRARGSWEGQFILVNMPEMELRVASGNAVLAYTNRFVSCLPTGWQSRAEQRLPHSCLFLTRSCSLQSPAGHLIRALIILIGLCDVINWQGVCQQERVRPVRRRCDSARSAY
jgi:hypothetical protein